MGNTVKDVLAGGLVGVTGGASLALLNDDDDNKGRTPRVISEDKEKSPGILQSARSRKDRLAAARGRQSFRLSREGLAPTRSTLQIDSSSKPQTRGGLSLG